MENADSADASEVEVSFSNDTNCQFQFWLSGTKEKGGTKLECNVAPCTSGIDFPHYVRMRQSGTDAWLIEKMQIQTYPGSSDFVVYSRDGQIPQFWVDGDTAKSEDPG